MPERVLPEPVSPVISQPRQKSSRVHDKPPSWTTAGCFDFCERLITIAVPAAISTKATMAKMIDMGSSAPADQDACQQGEAGNDHQESDGWFVLLLVETSDAAQLEGQIERLFGEGFGALIE
ncbi:MAG: hypothetical protein JWL59_4836 [Chthoniobacteraceae bacterium]|nr:hypothetical protein [Chthoniobacteraceae bacterium]